LGDLVFDNAQKKAVNEGKEEKSRRAALEQTTPPAEQREDDLLVSRRSGDPCFSLCQRRRQIRSTKKGGQKREGRKGSRGQFSFVTTQVAGKKKKRLNTTRRMINRGEPLPF